MHQSDHARFCGAVGHAVDLTVKADLAGREHDAAVALCREYRPSRLGHEKRADQVDVDHIAQVFERGVGECVAPIVAGIVHHDIERAESVDRALHHSGRGLRIGDAPIVRDRLAASRRDLCHYLIRGCTVPGIVTTLVDARIIHHDCGSAPGQLQGIGAAKPAPGTRYQCDAPVEANLAHAASRPLRLLQSVTAAIHSASC